MGSKGIVLLHLNFVSRLGWIIRARSLPLYPRELTSVPTVKKGHVACRASFEKRKSLNPIGERTPNLPARRNYAILSTLFVLCSVLVESFPISGQLQITQCHKIADTCDDG
jgi:hypothetical protein